MNTGNLWRNGNVEINNSIITNYISLSSPTRSMFPVATLPPPHLPMITFPNLNINPLHNQIQLPIPNGFILPLLPPISPFLTIIPSINHIQTQQAFPNICTPIQYNYPTFTPTQQQANSHNNTSTVPTGSPTESKQDENDNKTRRAYKQGYKSHKINVTKKGKKGNNEQHKYSYQPPPEIRAHKNVRIHKPFSLRIQQQTKKDFTQIRCHLEHKHKDDCQCDGVYLWLDIHIAMQSGTCCIHGTKIYNVADGLYVVIEKVDDIAKAENVGKNRKTRRWRMTEKLYTKQKIMQIYNLKENQLPIPPRKSPTFKSQLMQKDAIQSALQNQENITAIINNTKWCKVTVFCRVNNKERIEWKTTQLTFKQHLEKSTIHEQDKFELIPIMLFHNENYGIHHVVIININGSDMGISMIYDNSSESVKITGIHVNKEMIHIQHQWVSLEHLKECDHECLNNFDSKFDHLRIGNVDEDKNKIKSLKKTIETLGSDLKDLQEKYDREIRGKHQALNN